MGYQNVAHYKPFATKKKTKVKVENVTERRRPQSASYNESQRISKMLQQSQNKSSRGEWGIKM